MERASNSLAHSLVRKPEISPFSTLAEVSKLNPHLRSLSLRLNYPMDYMGCRELKPAPSDPLLRNVFPRLVHFSLKGLLDLPEKQTLYSFASAHTSLRSFTCYAYDKTLSLPADVFPKLEYLEGSVDLLVAVCDASSTLR